MVDESLRHDTRVVVAAAVAALCSSGDKYGVKLHAWLANVVDGESPSALPRLDDLRLSLELFECRQKVRDVVKDYRGLVHALIRMARRCKSFCYCWVQCQLSKGCVRSSVLRLSS